MLERLKQSLMNAPVIRKGNYRYVVHPITDGVPRVDPAILTEVLSDNAPEIRVAAVRALAALPSDRTREPLVALSRHKDFSKRTYLEKKEVFLALGRLRDPEIENWLIGVLKKRSWFAREEQDELRACAVAALALLGTDRAWKEIRAREKDKSPQVRRAVAQILRS